MKFHERIDWILKNRTGDDGKPLSMRALSARSGLSGVHVAKLIERSRARADDGDEVKKKTFVALSKGGDVHIIWLFLDIGSPDDRHEPIVAWADVPNLVAALAHMRERKQVSEQAVDVVARFAATVPCDLDEPTWMALLSDLTRRLAPKKKKRVRPT